MGTAEEQLDKLFNELNKGSKKFNPINTYRASDLRIGAHVPYGVRTRIPELDLALGRPGYPIGRIIELFGLERCGKTTAALMALAQAQRMGGSGLFIDTEYSFDPDRAEELGVDVDNVRYAEANTIEEIFRIINVLLDAMEEYTKPFVVIVDSTTGVPTEWEVEKNADFSSERPGKEAQAIKKGLRLITHKVAKKKILLILINHAIETMAMFGKKTKAGGGHGIKFHASARVGFTSIKDLKDKGDDRIVRSGQEIKIEIEKVKVAQLKFPEFRIDLLNESGFDTRMSLLRALCRVDAIKHTKGSSKYEWGDVKFEKTDWDDVIDQNGGEDTVYDYFIKYACENGHMKPFNSKDTK